MSHEYHNFKREIRISWLFEPEDDVSYDLDKFAVAMLFKFRDELMRDLLINDDDDWEQFIGGLSYAYDKIHFMRTSFHPMEGATLYIYKRVCRKCGKTCGLAKQFCDGTGKALGS